jgi:hypothetical protein
VSPEVTAAFEAMPAEARAGALALRELVLEVAAGVPEAGAVSEELRWGEPAYLTPETRSGTTIRIAAPKAGGYGLFVNCRTTLIGDFREVAPHLRFDGNRGVVFDAGEVADRDALGLLIRAALTYRL